MERYDRSDRPRFTGNALVAVHREISPQTIEEFVQKVAQYLHIFHFEGGADAFLARTTFFPNLGAAILPIDPDVLHPMVTDEFGLGKLIVGRERYLYTPRPVDVPLGSQPPSTLDILGVQPSHEGAVPVLILDNGFEATHPDFLNRRTNPMTFTTDGDGPEDLTGHGTHCTGLVAGPETPWKGPRYGVAYKAEISTGRVMEKATGSATDKAILKGLEWALSNHTVVVNMSLGTDVYFDDDYDPAFEEVASRVLDGRVLLVASAGNDPEDTRHPIEHPANCPSVMAVAALDENGNAAQFSCASMNPGQDVDIAAPGTLIHSAYRGDYAELSGTSMAAALASGVAALWASAPPKPRGRDLWNAMITSNPGPRNGAVMDVGSGLVQAPPP